MKATTQLEASGLRRFLTPSKQEKAEWVKSAALALCILVSWGKEVGCTPWKGKVRRREWRYVNATRICLNNLILEGSIS